MRRYVHRHPEPINAALGRRPDLQSDRRLQRHRHADHHDQRPRPQRQPGRATQDSDTDHAQHRRGRRHRQRRVDVAEDCGANTSATCSRNDTFENAGRAITAVGTASHGTVTINNNGTAGDPTDDFVVYTPTADYNGSDSFTYTVTSRRRDRDRPPSTSPSHAVADIADDSVTVNEDYRAERAQPARPTTGSRMPAAPSPRSAPPRTAPWRSTTTARRATPTDDYRRLHAERRLQRLRQLHLHGDLGRRDRDRDRQRQRQRRSPTSSTTRVDGRPRTRGTPTSLDLLPTTVSRTPAARSPRSAGHARHVSDQQQRHGGRRDRRLRRLHARRRLQRLRQLHLTVTSGGVTETATVNVNVSAVADIAGGQRDGG